MLVTVFTSHNLTDPLANILSKTNLLYLHNPKTAVCKTLFSDYANVVQLNFCKNSKKQRWCRVCSVFSNCNVISSQGAIFSAEFSLKSSFTSSQLINCAPGIIPFCGHNCFTFSYIIRLIAVWPMWPNRPNRPCLHRMFLINFTLKCFKKQIRKDH